MSSPIIFTLIDRHTALISAWQAAFRKHVPDAIAKRFMLVQKALGDLNASFDCVVSPANSYGMMDGGLDYYISEAICPEDLMAVTRAVQKQLYKDYRGFISPGQCCMVALPDSLTGPSNKLGCRYVAVSPTMRVPEEITWNADIVYECMWNLLAALDKHNAAAAVAGEAGREIKSVVMSGFGTGVGAISAERCAEQMALAIKHFHVAVQDPNTWSRLEWGTIYMIDDDIQDTRKL